MRSVRAHAGRMKRFTLPEHCSVKTFVMRELVKHEQPAVTSLAHRLTPAEDRKDPGAVQSAELFAAVRMALVEVDGQRVNVDGVPFMGFDDWTQRTVRFAVEAFTDLNGVKDDELPDFREGAEEIDERDLESATPSAPRVAG